MKKACLLVLLFFGLPALADNYPFIHPIDDDLTAGVFEASQVHRERRSVPLKTVRRVRIRVIATGPAEKIDETLSNDIRAKLLLKLTNAGLDCVSHDEDALISCLAPVTAKDGSYRSISTFSVIQDVQPIKSPDVKFSITTWQRLREAKASTKASLADQILLSADTMIEDWKVANHDRQ